MLYRNATTPLVIGGDGPSLLAALMPKVDFILLIQGRMRMPKVYFTTP